MKNKKTLMIAGLLIAVLALGVGYALNTIGIELTGNVNVDPNDANFAVEFVGASTAGEVNEASYEADAATFTVNSLSVVGDEATATFTIKNKSKAGVNASIDAVLVKTANGEFFTATTDWVDDTVLNPNEEKVMTVTVTLDKAPVTATIEGVFTVTLTATAEQG